MINTNIKDDFILKNKKRVALLEYINQNIEKKSQFIDEKAYHGNGKLEYSITIQQGSYNGSHCEYGMFDGLTLINEVERVSRATQKQLNDFILRLFTEKDYIELLDEIKEKWTINTKQNGQVWYYCEKFIVYLLDGYAVECGKDGSEHIVKVNIKYKPYGLDKPAGTVKEYKHQEYNPVNLSLVLEKYNKKTLNELEALYQENETRKEKLEAERKAEYDIKKEKEKQELEKRKEKASEIKGKYVLLQFNYQDNSDVMTDYFSNELASVDVLGEYDQPIRSTFAGGRMDIWRLLRGQGLKIEALKFKGGCYQDGSIMALQNKKYTGSGNYTEVKFCEVSKLSDYTIKHLKIK